MSPETVPLIICGSICLLPLLIGTGSFFAWCTILDRHPVRDMVRYQDENGQTHVRTEWTWLSREEIKIRGRREDKDE